MSLPFAVNSDVLIPRPETEILVETVINSFKNSNNVRILDIGCGSGAIGVTLAYYIPGAQIVCTDVSEKALSVAMQNARENNVYKRILFLRDNIFISNAVSGLNEKFDAVVSNPPYVSEEEWNSLEPEVKDWEPKKALVAEDNGLKFYPEIAGNAAKILKTQGFLAVEVGMGQADEVKNIFFRAGFGNLQIIDDYNQIPRVITGVLQKS